MKVCPSLRFANVFEFIESEGIEALYVGFSSWPNWFRERVSFGKSHCDRGECTSEVRMLMRALELTSWDARRPQGLLELLTCELRLLACAIATADPQTECRLVECPRR
jgi:hypothetical protein